MSTTNIKIIEAVGVVEKARSTPENPNRRVLHDRRKPNSDRRLNSINAQYDGPYRRELVDRRKNNKDRRSE
jgi:hypothetical protein